MHKLKFFVSPHFSGEVFEDKVTGSVYKKSNDITVYRVKIEEDKMAGLMEGFRKNFILPYDTETSELINSLAVTPAPVAKKRAVEAPVVEESPVEDTPVVEEEAPKKKANNRKRSSKKAAPVEPVVAEEPKIEE